MLLGRWVGGSETVYPVGVDDVNGQGVVGGRRGRALDDLESGQ